MFAISKVLLGLSLLTPLGPSIPDGWYAGLNTAVRSLPWLLPGLFLLLANGRQTRSASLGLAMLVFSTSGALAAMQALTDAVPGLRVLAWMPLTVFTPYFLGRFLLEYPRPRPEPSARWLRATTTIAGIVGIVRVLASLAEELPAGANGPWLLHMVSGTIDHRPGPIVNYILAVLILGLSFASFNGLLPEDRRRHRRLLPWWGVLTVVFLGVVIQMANAGPQGTFMTVTTAAERHVNGLLVLAMFTAPSLLAYEVLGGRRRALGHGLRRLVAFLMSVPVLLSLSVVPPAIVAVLAYRAQDRLIGDIFTRSAVSWLLLSAICAGLLVQRRHLLRLFNRWFFREHYDAGETLYELTTRMRQSKGIDEMVAHLTSTIDRIFRPHRVVVLVRDESATQFVPLFGSAEPLSATSLLADLLTAGHGVLDTPLAGGSSPMRWLPQEERYWLVDCGAQVVVPMHASDGSLNGLIAISDRKSGRPFSDDDRQWLTSVAEAASLTIESHSAAGIDTTAPGSVGAWRVGLVQRQARALECPSCGRVESAEAPICTACGDSLVESRVPHLLFGKFRFEQRVGRGGMGVVYRAIDLALERPVAIKMLPGATPEYSERLRLEARAMAAVTHRHLAVVYGVEAWRGQPLLVCEYMERGTLTDRLATGPMSTDDVLSLGIALAEALDVIHGRRMLHRDLKPSNIGFDRTGLAKILDFGLAQLVSPTDEPTRPAGAGTPLYMSPEALDGGTPSTAGDVWALHVMLYEAIAGRHPFRGTDNDATLRAIRLAHCPRLTPTDVTGDRAARIASYFDVALSAQPQTRPQTAAAVAETLRRLMA